MGASNVSRAAAGTGSFHAIRRAFDFAEVAAGGSVLTVTLPAGTLPANAIILTIQNNVTAPFAPVPATVTLVEPVSGAALSVGFALGTAGRMNSTAPFPTDFPEGADLVLVVSGAAPLDGLTVGSAEILITYAVTG